MSEPLSSWLARPLHSPHQDPGMRDPEMKPAREDPPLGGSSPQEPIVEWSARSTCLACRRPFLAAWLRDHKILMWPRTTNYQTRPAKGVEPTGLEQSACGPGAARSLENSTFTQVKRGAWSELRHLEIV